MHDKCDLIHGFIIIVKTLESSGSLRVWAIIKKLGYGSSQSVGILASMLTMHAADGVGNMGESLKRRSAGRHAATPIRAASAC